MDVEDRLRGLEEQLTELEAATQLRTAPPEGNQGIPGNIPGVAQDAPEAMPATASDPRRH
ncbi:hypothetical protein M422DRAFT_272883 [Sphaerobolus stellatus SS14]|uniref:Uncharacterized protein n=1 Tax=Sphaerobolus stellatus (strain SS14) TaxID=990650 RepID=A0A0C9ULE4_SPHS4|nr:hypothetical protein M422DRAFT_272883 [Sphaerobolus stellatus SS14]